MKKVILFVIFISLFTNNFVYSQCVSDPALTYWYYRDRLKYFAVPGTHRGESEVMDIRNRIVDAPAPNYSTWGQEQLYLGLYVGTLATEYKLLTLNGQYDDAQKDITEISNALNQFDNYLDKTAYWGDDSTVLNGFFVRENVPCNFLNTISTLGKQHRNLLNNNLTKYDLWNGNRIEPYYTFNGLPQGHPGWCDTIDVTTCGDAVTNKEAMSQDDAIHILVGLALVHKFCDVNDQNGYNLKTHSRDIACRIITWIQKAGPQRWVIVDGKHHVVGSGANAFGESYAFVMAAKYFDSDCVDRDVQSDLMSIAWHSGMYWGAGSGGTTLQDNAAITSSLAAIGNSWEMKIDIKSPCCNGHRRFWRWCCFHWSIVFGRTPIGICNQVQRYDNETYFLLLWEVLNESSTSKLSLSKVLSQLNSAPCDGPFKYQNPILGDSIIGWVPSDATDSSPVYTNYLVQHGIGGCNGWCTPIRWENNKDAHTVDGAGGPLGNFNGLDYTLLYNLYCLATNSSYKSYLDLNLSGILNTDSTYAAIRSIASTQNIYPICNNAQTHGQRHNVIGGNNTCNINVNYVAGDSIRLKPGFSAQQGSGSLNFHAYIAPVTGCDTAVGPKIPESLTSKYPPDNENNVTTTLPCEYDSLGRLIPLDTLILKAPFTDTTFTVPGGSSNGNDTTITTGPFSYQWSFSNGQTANTDSVYLYCTNPGTYNGQLIVKLDTFPPDTYNFTIIKTYCPPYNCTPVSITSQPSNITQCTGTNATFSISASGTYPLSYLWQYNDMQRPFDTTNTLTINNISKTDSSSTFFCMVSNTCASITSSTVTLTVNVTPPAFIDTIPNQSICQGDSITFTANAAGPDISYQWIKNGNNITNATNSKYTSLYPQSYTPLYFNPDFPTYAYDLYSCIVSNSCGSANLPQFMLIENYPPRPDNLCVNQPKQKGDTVTYSLTEYGTGPFKFQWMHSGVNITGATTSDFTINGIACGDTGAYSCKIANSCDSVVTKVVNLYVLNCPGYRRINNNQTTKNQVQTIIEPTVNIYPNPNDGSFTLELKLPSDGNVTLKAYNVLGELVQSSVFQFQSPLSIIHYQLSITKGIYFLNIITPTKTFNRKVIIE